MTTDSTIEATISERGNGFPDPGDYVPGDDGQLYRVVSLGGTIHTGCRSGQSNYMYARVELADWSDTESDDDVFSALAILAESEDY